jgi:hypothetical protein
MIFFLILSMMGLVLLGVFGYFSEKKTWNGGISPHDGSVWEHFDNDSQGGRGYKDASGNYIWISWPVDRLKPVK